MDPEGGLADPGPPAGPKVDAGAPAEEEEAEGAGSSSDWSFWAAA